MTNKKEPIWTASRIEKTAKELYKQYSNELDKDPQIGFSMVLREFCILQCKYFQLQEAFMHNHKVSSGAYENSHKAVEKYQQLDGILKTSTSSFSKRLETLEGYGK